MEWPVREHGRLPPSPGDVPRKKSGTKVPHSKMPLRGMLDPARRNAAPRRIPENMALRRPEGALIIRGVP